MASGFKGVQTPPSPPPPPPIGPSVWFFLNVSDAKIIAKVARYYSISQFLIFSGRKDQNSYEFFFFLIFYLKSDRNLHPSQPYIRCRVVIGQVISLIPLIQLSFVQ